MSYEAKREKEKKEKEMKEEVCRNPFRKRKCKRTDIAVYIVFKGEKLPICNKCWEKIAVSDYEWGDEK